MAEKSLKVSNSEKDFELENLLLLEKASRIITSVYEKSVRNYDNSISDDNKAEYHKFEQYNSLHSKILNCIESKLEKLV